jgi:CHAT domain-containing protein
LILSACETGSGSLVNGEGIISLSRAFSYAGCKSVITSLWKADDISTAFIVKRVHHYLQKGLKKDEALQKAKIDYLNNNEIDEHFKTPAWWAHLILIGNYQSVAGKGFSWNIILLAVLLSGLLIFILFKKRPGH